jgi:multidrug resistance efflux pump
MEQSVQKPSSRRRVPLAVWLGVMLLVATLGFVGLGLRSHAGDGATNGTTNGSTGPRAVAIAYVDVEGGVTSLYPVKPGRVAEVWLQEGKEVPAGEKLFRIEDALEKAQVAEAVLAIEAAKEKLKQAQSLAAQQAKNVVAHKQAIEVFKKKAEAARWLADKARRFRADKLGGTAEDVKAAAAAQAEAEAAVKAAEAKLAVVEATDATSAVRLATLDIQAKEKEKEKADFALDQCVVRAPSKGQVLRSQMNVGDVLGPMPQQPVVEFCPSAPRIVRAEVEQEFAGQVSLGQLARIEDDSAGGGEPDRHWRGKVVRISDWYSRRRSVQLEPLQYNDVRTLEVILSLEPSTKALPLRIRQRVRVILPRNNNG